MLENPPQPPSLADEDDLQHIIERELSNRDARWPAPVMAPLLRARRSSRPGRDALTTSRAAAGRREQRA